jgi:phage terminase large subunit-like protein
MAARAERKVPECPPGVQSAVDYADAVIAGTVDAGQLVHLACERFYRDLKGNAWEFRPELAELAMDFAGSIPNIKAII